MPTKTSEDSPVQLTGDQMDQGGAALGGAAKGALIGAKIGTLIPIPGVSTLVGAGVGAAVGGLGSFFRERKAQKEEEQEEKLLADFQTSSNASNQTQGQIQQNMSSFMPTMPNQGLVSPYSMIAPKKNNMEKKEKAFKALTPYTASYSAYNMSAKQANKEPLMKQISGSNSALEANAFYAALNDAKEKGAETFKVGDKSFNVK
jgi:predicted membrane-bound mannosyltransferase